MKLLKKIKKWFSTRNEEECYVCGKKLKADWKHHESIKIVLGYLDFEYSAFDRGKEQKLPWKFHLCKYHREVFENFLLSLKSEQEKSKILLKSWTDTDLEFKNKIK